jgi:hypothetical protein
MMHRQNIRAIVKTPTFWALCTSVLLLNLIRVIADTAEPVKVPTQKFQQGTGTAITRAVDGLVIQETNCMVTSIEGEPGKKVYLLGARVTNQTDKPIAIPEDYAYPSPLGGTLTGINSVDADWSRRVNKWASTQEPKYPFSTVVDPGVDGTRLIAILELPAGLRWIEIGSQRWDCEGSIVYRGSGRIDGKS